MKINLYWVVECMLLHPYEITYIDRTTLELVCEYYYENIIDNKEDCVPIHAITYEELVELMKKFCYSLDEKIYTLTMDESLREVQEFSSKEPAKNHLNYNEKGRSHSKSLEYVCAFNHFIFCNDIEDEWIDFRDKELLKPAREICEKNNIDYYVDKNIIGTVKIKRIENPEIEKARAEFSMKKRAEYSASLYEKEEEKN